MGQVEVGLGQLEVRLGQLEVRLGQVEAFSPRNPPKGVSGRQTSQTRTHKASNGDRKMMNSVYWESQEKS